MVLDILVEVKVPSRSEIIRKTEQYVRKEMAADSTGHDWWHVVRVRSTALAIAREEGADVFVVELAALLHDILDYKFSGSEEAGPQAAYDWLTSLKVESAIVNAVVDIIRHMSYKGSATKEAELSSEGNCVRDADRLDAMGAIGIARVFATGAQRGRPIHNPEQSPQTNQDAAAYISAGSAGLETSVNHFYEKLLLLRDRMTTETGRRIAERRHRKMEDFLQELYLEWNGKDIS